MAREKPIEIFTPPNALKAKIGGPLPALDQRAIQRAEQALAKLSDQFGEWIKEELDRLLEAWGEYEKLGSDPHTKSELHRRAHDLKGLAPTYGYPLVGRICNSLCKLTSDEAIGINPPVQILKAHVDAVRAIVAGKIMSAEHPVGVALANELEGRMLELTNSMNPAPQG
jgi:HPt (histidine-containing phosphotransfer) domain-containing protein